jgi:hypothetical protein
MRFNKIVNSMIVISCLTVAQSGFSNVFSGLIRGAVNAAGSSIDNITAKASTDAISVMLREIASAVDRDTVNLISPKHAFKEGVVELISDGGLTYTKALAFVKAVADAKSSILDVSDHIAFFDKEVIASMHNRLTIVPAGLEGADQYIVNRGGREFFDSSDENLAALVSRTDISDDMRLKLEGMQRMRSAIAEHKLMQDPLSLLTSMCRVN